MAVKIENARKIVVGSDWNNYKVYQKNSSYRQPEGQCKLTDFIQSDEDPNMVEIFLQSEEGAKFKWKVINKSTFLEVEYDSNVGG